MQTSKSGTRSNDFRIAKFYGCVSAAFAQAESIHKFLPSDYQGGTLLSSVSIGSFDDAQMWMKDPCSKADRESGLRREGMKLPMALFGDEEPMYASQSTMLQKPLSLGAVMELNRYCDQPLSILQIKSFQKPTLGPLLIDGVVGKLQA